MKTLFLLIFPVLCFSQHKTPVNHTRNILYVFNYQSESKNKTDTVCSLIMLKRCKNCDIQVYQGYKIINTTSKFIEVYYKDYNMNDFFTKKEIKAGASFVESVPQP